MDSDEEREEELSSLTAIFPEIEIDAADKYAFTLKISVTPTEPPKINFEENGGAEEGEVHTITHLPPITLHMSLPKGYPASNSPLVKVHAIVPWIPAEKLDALESQAKDMWEQYGQSQMAFDYIDSLQQAAERAFDLPSKGVLSLPPSLKPMILSIDRELSKAAFNRETFDCGVCLDPKKGSACHKMHKCGHVFCKECLQDAFNGAITGGDVSSVKCPYPDCGVERDSITKRATKAAPTLGPDELLEIPIVPATVVRYVNLKRKKRFESFPQTVYCPRKWCQGIAHHSLKKLKPVDQMTASDLEPEAILADKDAEPKDLRNNEDRLRICEDCELAFCRTCLATWHGEFGPPCWPRTADELTEDELASRAYLMKNTSPCPTCNFAVQKSMGCNHITCYNCRQHFCYLCSAWLSPSNPYEHFNKPGSSCHQRLWDMEEGDNVDGNMQFLGIRGAEMAAALAEEEEREAARAAAAAGNPQPLPAEEAEAPPDQDQDNAQVDAAQQNLQNLNLNEPDAPVVAPPPPPAQQEDEEDEWFFDAWGNLVHRPDWRNLNFERRPAGQPRRQNRHPVLGGRGTARFHEGQDWARYMGGPRPGGAHIRNRRAIGRDIAGEMDVRPQRVLGHGVRHPADAEAVAVAALQRFLEMAAEDREDEWDSDEMEGEDGEWAIPEAPARDREGGEERVLMPFLAARR